MRETEAFASRLLVALDLDDRRLTTTRTASIDDENFISKAVSAVFECLARPSALSTNMRLLRGGKEISRELWSASRMSHGQVVHTELIAPFVDTALINGDLMVIDSIDECDPTMMFLREALEYVLSARVWINVYITATSASSFGPHTDDMDTIIVQLFGRKRWIVADGPGYSRESFPVAASTLDLSPGSVLVVPAGTYHNVTGLGELTLHLTIGVDQEVGLLHRLRMLNQLLGRSTPELSSVQLQMAKAKLPDRRVGSSLPFQATRHPDHCRYIRWASQLPPILRVIGNGGVEVRSMGQQLQFDCKHAAAVQALASGAELEFDDLVGISGLERDALVSFLIESVAAGLVICRV